MNSASATTLDAYLAAIVGANLSASYFGPSATIFNAFLFVGLVMTTRDRLHDLWRDRVRQRMALLILAGGGLSYLLGNPQIALASCVAFVASESADWLVYHKLRKRAWLVRSNASNSAGAIVDSIVFPTLAFGALLPWIILGQIAAKIWGGTLWSLLLRKRAAVALPLLLLAVPADAQIVALGAGMVLTEVGEEETLELFLATPPAGRLRLTAVLASSAEGVAIGKLSYGATKWLSLESGATWLKFRDYEPEWFVGLFFRRRLGERLQLGIALSSEPEQDWNTTVVVKVDFWTWFRR